GHLAAAIEVVGCPRMCLSIRSRDNWRRTPYLDNPEFTGEPRRQMYVHAIAIRGRRPQGGVQCAAGIDDKKVAGRAPVWQFAKSRVNDRVIIDSRDQKADIVAPPAARFRWLRCVKMGEP